jgi:general secretion pathway protein I
VLSRSNAVECGAAGFTLIEALVALAIVGLALASLSTLIGTTTRGTRAIETHWRRLEIAREILTALPSRDQLAPGKYWGEDSGNDWRIDVSPFQGAGVVADARSAWTPEEVTVTVKPPMGPAIQISSIRLRHRDQQ